MEDKLFDMNGADIDDVGIQMYDVTLKVPIGEYEVGTKFDSAYINNAEGRLTLYKNRDTAPTARFEIEYKIGKQL